MENTAGTRILIIEDNKDNLELVHFLLERVGYDILSAVDGVKGIELAKKEKPDLILLDLEIPELDGWQAASQLKAAPETSAIPVIALTAHTLPGDRKRALDAGCDGYIPKPINVATFPEDVQKYLSDKAIKP